MQKFTYAEWLKGQVGISSSCKIIWSKGETPIICTWADFRTKDDVLKIKRKQKEIFWKKKDAVLTKYKNIFNKKYKSSSMKKELLEDELNDFNTIMSDEFEGKNMGPFVDLRLKNHQSLIFFPQQLVEIREYINYVIKQGDKRVYTNIHSPKFRYQEKTLAPNEVYAQVIWEYCEWLKEYNDLIKTTSGKSNEAHISKVDPHNNDGLNSKPLNEPSIKQPNINDGTNEEKEEIDIRETTSKKLKLNLQELGFFELLLVKKLNEEMKEGLLTLLNRNLLPYRIAMCNYLGFISHLRENYFQTTKREMYIEISKLFNSDKDGRSVAGNIRCLEEKKSKESRKRYTAHTLTDKVEKDYHELK